jgi:hypothetical protein
MTDVIWLNDGRIFFGEIESADSAGDERCVFFTDCNAENAD